MTAAATPAIRARGVTKVYGDGALAFHALRGVDLDVAEGELVMLVGPSGSGKTTLLSILGCVMAATAGEVALFGLPISGRAERELPQLRRALIGFVFQGHNLIAALSARDNVRAVLELRGVPHRRAGRDAAALLEQVGLGDKLGSRPAELSGGQRQRVAIARALAGAPPLVLADEPTAALDAATGHQVTQLLVELCRERGTTIVVVTHDNRIFDLADRIVRLEDGRLVAAGQEAA
ncbi:MAG: ABC transporter ATP-binding protein [Kofleriaceae bacterium]|nr:ABC transporter ATP-binding protein [Kofleriaceae bacterium]MCB9565593.1 ABC transporter ATP-binding protein [Kofleriaceae bacterium]